MEYSIINESKAANTIMDLAQSLVAAKKVLESQWKSKSLDPMPLEKYAYEIKAEIAKVEIKPKQQKSFMKKLFGKKENLKTEQVNSAQKLKPSPRIAKINFRIFCISINRQIRIYFFAPKNAKIKRRFDYIEYDADEDITFVAGNDTTHIFIGHKDKIVILKLVKTDDIYEIVSKSQKIIPSLKGFSYLEDQLFAVSSNKFYTFTLDDLVGKQKAIEFKNEEESRIFGELNSISLIVQDVQHIYFFGTKKQTKTQVNMKAQNIHTDSAVVKQCQILVITKLQIQYSQNKQHKVQQKLEVNKPSQKKNQKSNNIYKSNHQFNGRIKATLFTIDYIFDLEIFNRSKVYALEKEMFLLSLYQEVILIKRHFNKFIVWDNISILSSKNAQKKGQLVLADNRIMVYSETNQIYAYDLFFNEEQSKLNMPAIDSFKGNDNDDQILYDAVLLQSNVSMMKVLFYFKQNDIILPGGNKFLQSSDDKKQSNKLNFSIICIVQSDPKQKLIDLMKAKKQANEINQFAKRFNITDLEKNKSAWMVSKKAIKDIENTLLEINDNNFIEQELVKILKEKPHDLNFLIAVEKKQGERLKKVIVRSLINLYYCSDIQPTKPITQTQEQQKLKELNIVIQWFMESMMFLKKLNYSKNFLSFKQYDFIQIGKLKAASIKEQIKLLSCKKFEKRLKYFLNSFKYLAIADYQQIFSFLLENKSVEELQQFIMSFKFIMPTFVEVSNVFLKKKRAYNIIQQKSNIIQHTQSIIDQVSAEEPCYLWDEFPTTSSQPNTQQSSVNLKNTTKTSDSQQFSNVENFQRKIIDDINNFSNDPSYYQAKTQAIASFVKLLNKFIQTSWFKNSAFKQHATLTISTQTLRDKFYNLKNEGVFKQFIKHVYSKIQKRQFEQKKVQQLLERFVDNRILPQSFVRNIEARVKVYDILVRQTLVQATISHLHMKRQLKLREDFLIMKEPNYFQYLLYQFRNIILGSIKSAYDSIQSQFFRERFQFYLNSQLANLDTLIFFIEQFHSSDLDQIRLDVFRCIKKLLKLSDYENTKKFNERSLDKQIFLEDKSAGQQLDLQDLKQEAKVPYGFYFYNLFRVLNLEYTYQDLIKSSQCPILSENNLIKDILQLYCSQSYIIEDNSCLLMFEDGLALDKIDPVEIHEKPLNFLGILLHLLDTLDFKLHQIDIFKQMVQNYLNNGKFHILSTLVNQLENFQIQQILTPTRNYQIIADFKQSNYIHKILNEKTVEWVKDSYNKIKSIQAIDSVFESIDQTFKLLQDFSRDAEVEKQKAFFMMLKLIKQFDRNLMLMIEYLRQELKSSGFIFMMHLIHNGDITIFDTDAIDIIEDKIYNFYCIFAQFKQASTGQIIDSMQSGQMVRFLIQLGSILINKKYYKSSERILQKIVVSNQYCRDLMFMFFSHSRYEELIQNQMEEFIRDLLQTQTPALIKKKIALFSQKAYMFQNEINVLKQNTINVFKHVMQNHKPHEAFFFLLRTNYIELIDVVGVVNELNPKSQINYAYYFVLIAYIRCLNKHIGNQFYPTFQFFRSKFDLLESQMDRMDVIKDINIGLSRLKTNMINETDEKKIQQLKISCNQLQCFYKQFMLSIDLQPQIKLTEEEFMKGSQRIDRYTRYIPPDILNKPTEEVKARSQLKNNQEKLAKVNKDNKFQVIQKQIKSTIAEAKKLQNMIEQRHQQQAKSTVAAQREKQYQNINKQQQEEIQSVHQTYKSASSQRVQQVLDSVRKRRQPDMKSRTDVKPPTYAISGSQVSQYNVDNKKNNYQTTKSKTYAQTIIKDRQTQKQQRQKVHQQRSRIYTNQSQKIKQQIQKAESAFDKVIMDKKPKSRFQSYGMSLGSNNQSDKTHTVFSGASQYRVNVIQPKGEEKVLQSPIYMGVINKVNFDSSPIAKTITNSQSKKSQVRNVMNNNTENLNEIKKSYESKNVDQTKGIRKKVQLPDLQKIFKQKQPQASKYLSKIELIKQNMKVGVQLIKRIYKICQNFSSFEKFLEYLLGVDDRFKEVIEEKALTIYSHMNKIDAKIDFKELIPIQLFTTVHHVSLKQYYPYAFDIIKPSLKQLLQKPDIQVHAVALLFRYGFGSEMVYYYQVYEEYIRTLLKDYQKNAVDQRKSFLLAEKLKNAYGTLNPENRAHHFFSLIDEMPKGQKKAKLAHALQNTLARRSDIATTGAINEQFANAVSSITKKLLKDN